MDIAHIQGEMQSLPNRDQAHSKLFTVMEISMSFMCFFWNRAMSSHNPETIWCLVQLLQQTMSLLIQIIVAVPKLAKQDCGWATEEPRCARWTNVLCKQLRWSHWNWLWNKFMCNLIDFMNLLNSWEYTEPTSCQESWCHHYSFKPERIHHSSHNPSSICVCWQAQSKGRLAAWFVLEPENTFFIRNSLVKGNKLFHTPKKHPLSLQNLPE